MQLRKECYEKSNGFFFFFVRIGYAFTIILFVVFLIKSTSKGPFFFIQERVGREGKIFKMIKLRTMYVTNSYRSPITKKDDVQITKVGRFLRRYKLDELPGLINVLLGQMSLVRS